MGAGVMVFINETDVIGRIISSGTDSMTGTLELSLFFILFFLIAMCLMFQIPLEFLVVFILPFCIAVASNTGSFFAPIVAMVFYIGVVIAKNWLYR